MQEKLRCKQIITSVGLEPAYNSKSWRKAEGCSVDLRFESCVNWWVMGWAEGTFQQPEEEANPMQNLLQNLSVIWNVQINGSGFSGNDTWIKPIHLFWGRRGRMEMLNSFQSISDFLCSDLGRACYWVLAKRTEGKSKFRQRLPASGFCSPSVHNKEQSKNNKKNAYVLQKEDKEYSVARI